jgi:molybdenum cofactor cytidylyltransferase
VALAGRVVGVMLAAGASVRLGRPKQLLDLAGKPLIRHSVRHALAANLDEVIVVLGARADEVLAAIEDLPVTVVTNPEFAAGQSTSFRAGLAEAEASGAGAVVVLLGDQPEIEPSHIDAVVAGYLRGGASIVQALYGDQPGHPVLFSRPLFSELEAVTGDEGARSVIRHHQAEVLRVRVADGPPPADIDTEADYQSLLTRWAMREAAR